MALNSNSTAIKAMALALAGAAAAVPTEAEACSPNICAYSDTWTSLGPLNAQAIPTDGVLVLQGTRSGGSPEEDWLDKVDLTVTRDGQPIAGAVEAAGVRNVLVWRPAAPLEPGNYQVTGSLDNPDDELYEYCGTDLELDFDFDVEAAPSSPLAAPQVEFTEKLDIRVSQAIDELVCCDEAMPHVNYYDYGDCGGGGDVEWDEGFCTGHQAFGSLRVEAAVTVDLPPATAALVVRQLEVDGLPFGGIFDDLLYFSDAGPFCVAVRLTNLATGETMVSEPSCHGDDPETKAQLGKHAIDPGPVLAERCSQGAYTCELDESGAGWDPDKCSPWPGESDPTEGPTSGGPGTDTGASDGTGGPDSATGGADGLTDHGCACDTGAPSPLGALALLGLALIRPRRRRRRST